MKNYLKYSILITLTLVMLTGIAFAVPPKIGQALQSNPYESHFQTGTASLRTNGFATPTVGTTLPNAYDGDIATSAKISVSQYGTNSPNKAYGTGWEQFSNFQNTPPETFGAITWVSLQIKWQGAMNLTPTAADWDWYKLQWTVDAAALPTSWTDLTVNTNRTDYDKTAAQFYAWSQITPPDDGVWDDWTDINNIKVRLFFTRGNLWDNKQVQIFELWVSVYDSPVPPISSTTMSIQPKTVSGLTAAGDEFFVEVYVNDATALAGGSFVFTFDPVVLQVDTYWLYYPLTDSLFPTIDNGNGIVTIDFSIPVYMSISARGDPEAATGVTGGIPIARLYFAVQDYGDGTPMLPNYSWLLYQQSYIFDKDGAKIPHPVYHGLYGNDNLPAGTSLVGTHVPRPGLPPPFDFPYTDPISTNWVEQYPNLGNQWHLSSIEENPDNYLSPSDQIDMLPTDPSGLVQWFHVDQIWGCDADPDAYVYMILTHKEVTPEFPLGIGMLMAIVPLIPVIYLWRTRPKKTKRGD